MGKDFYKITIVVVAKWLVILLSFGYIFFKIKNTFPFTDETQVLPIFTSLDILFLIIVIILMPLNWLIESIKWSQLMQPLEEISLSTSIKAVVAGISVSLITPNRSGEFAGRVAFLKPENRLQGSGATIIGSFSQLLTTIIFGFAGLLFFFGSIKPEWLSPMLLKLAMVSFPVFIIILLLGYFQLYKLVRIKWIVRFLPLSLLNSQVRDLILLKTLVYSIYRYIVFAFQFSVLLHIAQPEASILTIISGVSSVYFISSLIPSFALAEIGVRTSVTAFIFSFAGFNAIAVIVISLLIWILNIAIPAIAGYLAILRLRL